MQHHTKQLLFVCLQASILSKALQTAFGSTQQPKWAEPNGKNPSYNVTYVRYVAPQVDAGFVAKHSHQEQQFRMIPVAQHHIY